MTVKKSFGRVWVHSPGTLRGLGGLDFGSDDVPEQIGPVSSLDALAAGFGEEAIFDASSLFALSAVVALLFVETCKPYS